MPRCVEQVEDNAVLLECHDRGGYGNAALLFDLHPVRTRPSGLPACLDLAGKMDRAALKQQLFGQRRFTGIGVGYDCKGTAVQRHARRLEGFGDNWNR